MATEPILKLEGISKSFPGVKALDDVSFDVRPGEVHVLMGENGAGKSTLIKIVSGVYRNDEGKIHFDGKEVHLQSPIQARNLGISTVYQELTLAPHLSVAENIYMGRLPKKGGGAFVDWKALYAQAGELIEENDLKLNPKAMVNSLTVGYRQMVEIARALSVNAKVVIFDEPTAVLTQEESSKLFMAIEKLKARGVGIIYISHRIAEILDMADRITVLRDGQFVKTIAGAGATYEEVVRLMVGRDIEKSIHEKSERAAGAPALEVDHFSRGNAVKDASFNLYHGEILGFYGLVGSGRTELVRLIFGLDKLDGGQIKIAGKEVAISGPRDAIRHGMGFLPEDRRLHGLVLPMDVSKNINLANHRYIQKRGFIRAKTEKAVALKGVEDLSIRTPGLRQLVGNLSGGNQQKVIIARWLCRHPRPRILILDEPTRGVDVGAKSEIHRLIKNLAKDGLAVIMVSSDMPEVLTVSDRIIAMREGRIISELSREEATEEKLIFAVTH